MEDTRIDSFLETITQIDRKQAQIEAIQMEIADLTTKLKIEITSLRKGKNVIANISPGVRSIIPMKIAGAAEQIDRNRSYSAVSGDKDHIFLQEYNRVTKMAYALRVADDISYPEHNGQFVRINIGIDMNPLTAMELFSYGYAGFIIVNETKMNISKMPSYLVKMVDKFREDNPRQLIGIKVYSAAPEKDHAGVYALQLFRIGGDTKIDYDNNQKWKTVPTATEIEMKIIERRALGFLVIKKRLEGLIENRRGEVLGTNSNIIAYAFNSRKIINDKDLSQIDEIHSKIEDCKLRGSPETIKKICQLNKHNGGNKRCEICQQQPAKKIEIASSGSRIFSKRGPESDSSEDPFSFMD